MRYFMQEEKDLNMIKFVTIYVKLLDENVDVRRPVKAIYLGKNIYKMQIKYI